MRAIERPPRAAPRNRVLPADDHADGQEWDDFVSRQSDSTPCHLFGWRDVMEDVLGHEPVYRLVRDERDRLVGVLPLVHVRAAPLGSYLISMPFINHGGPLGDETTRASLVKEALGEAARRRVDLLELRVDRLLEGTALHVSHRKITVLLDLPDTAEELWESGFGAKLRSQIRRPMKDAMEPRFGVDELDAFYDVFSRHMRDLGTPVLPFRYFERVRDTFGDSMEFCTIYHGSTPVAVGFGFVWNGEFELVRASALREFSRSAPNMLLYWALMERMIQRGVRVFNFGRCSPGSGTHRFKRQWGGHDVPLPWLQWSRGHATAPPSDDRALLRMASAVWQRVPLVLANRVGPLLARRLP